MTKSEEELDQLLPATHTLQLAGRMVALAPVQLGQLPAILRLARPLIEHYREQGKTAAQPDVGAPVAPVVEIKLLDLMEQHGETLLNLCSLLSRTERAWLDTLTLDDALLLLSKLIEINRDFFVRRMGPALITMMLASGTVPVSSLNSGTSSRPSPTPSSPATDGSPGPTPPSG